MKKIVKQSLVVAVIATIGGVAFYTSGLSPEEDNKQVSKVVQETTPIIDVYEEVVPPVAEEVIDEEAPVAMPAPQEVNQNVVAQEAPQRTLADMTGQEILSASDNLHTRIPYQLECAAQLMDFPLFRQRMHLFDNNPTLALGYASDQVLNNKIEWIKAGYTCSYYPSWRI